MVFHLDLFCGANLRRVLQVEPVKNYFYMNGIPISQLERFKDEF